MDPKADGQLQKDWVWLIGLYLTLGGLGAGAYFIAAVNGLFEGLPLATSIGLWISFPAVALGSVFLVADLGSPVRSVLAGIKVDSSWIARGFWVISLFMVVAFIHTVLLQFTEAPNATLINALSIVGIVLAVGTMAYTGILLGASKGIPFWRSAAIEVVFILSALVTGLFAIMLGMVKTVLSRHPGEVKDYQSGKTKLLGFFVGQVMKATQGKANPKTVNQILKGKLEAD